MSTYRNIHGRSIQAVSTDPTESVAEGQIWYNTNSDTFKSIVALEAWSSSGPTTTARHVASGAGLQTSALLIGGRQGTAPPYTDTTATEEYNGSGWSTGGALPAANSRAAAAGTQTAAINFGGYAGSKNTTQIYDGSTWTAGNNLNTGRDELAGAGIQTAGLAISGATNADAPLFTATEHYDGTSWTAGGDVNTARRIAGGAGTQTAGLFAGGYTPSPASYRNESEEYNGTAWTVGNTLNTARQIAGTGGTQTDAVYFGGATPGGNTSATEKYDGTDWSTSPATLGTARAQATQSGIGTGSNALCATGWAPPGTTLNEEYNRSANVITAGAWASSGSLNVPRVQTYGAGSQTAGLIFGGEGPSGDQNQTEEYNGSTWTAVNNMPSANKDHAGFGIQTAAVACGGNPTTTSINYDGTNWTASPGSLNTGRTNAGGTGTQTAGLTFGGYPSVTATEHYNGSSWTAGGALPTGRQNYFAAGTQTAALGAGGGPPTATDTFLYDGSSWTSGGALISGTIDARGGGTQTDALYAGGYLSPGSGYPTTTLGYDGTNWSTRPSLGSATAGGGSGQNAAPASANWIAGGNPSPAVAATQEFTGETSALNVKTLTQS